MAAAVRRPSRLVFAVTCLALLHLLPHATTGKRHLVRSRTHALTNNADALLQTSDAPPTAARWPAFYHHLRELSALSNASQPHRLRFSGVAPKPEESAISTTRAPPRPRLHLHGIHTTYGAVVDVALPLPAPYKEDAPSPSLLRALPLLAVPFLPPPLAALAALASLTTPARAGRSSDCFKLYHATCSIYPYDNETGTIDRTRSVARRVCLHPLCHADSDARLYAVIWAQKHGRVDDLLQIYCTVRTLEGEGGASIFPWRNTWRVELPIAVPGAAHSGGDICYLELAHLGYTEGYYIRCPAAGEHYEMFCTEFPEEEIAVAVWEHRSLTYRATVGPRYATYQDKYNHHDEL